MYAECFDFQKESVKNINFKARIKALNLQYNSQLDNTNHNIPLNELHLICYQPAKLSFWELVRLLLGRIDDSD